MPPPPLTAEKLLKIGGRRKSEKKSGEKGENQEKEEKSGWFFHLTDRAGQGPTLLFQTYHKLKVFFFIPGTLSSKNFLST